MTTISAFPSPWSARFAHLPVFPGRSILPAMDGDIAWLHHLRAEIRDQRHPGMFCPAPEVFWRATVERTGIDPDQILGGGRWPDAALVLLRAWREDL